MIPSNSNLVHEPFRLSGWEDGLLHSTWMVLGVVAAVITEALVLRPCQAKQRSSGEFSFHYVFTL